MDVNAYGKKVQEHAARKEKAGLQQLGLGKLWLPQYSFTSKIS